MSESFEESSIECMTVQNRFVPPEICKGAVNRVGSVTRNSLEIKIDSTIRQKISDSVAKAVKAIEAMQKNTDLMKALRTIREGKGDKATVEIVCKEFDVLEKELLAREKHHTVHE